MGLSVRPARAEDAEDVAAFVAETWTDRPPGGDYLDDVFPRWVADDDPDSRALVAECDGAVVGCVQAVTLSPWEAWLQGLRVAPAARDSGVASALMDAAVAWARERGAAVARAMVFSWNEMGLGLARAAGLDPTTAFRFVHPDPASGEAPGGDPDRAWALWNDSAARDHLRGLALDPAETWAVSTLTRERLHDAADDGRLHCVEGGFAVRVRAGEAHAEYGAAAWRDADACGALLDAVAADAAALGVSSTRVVVPETVRAVSDVSRHRCSIADGPDFVLGTALR